MSAIQFRYPSPPTSRYQRASSPHVVILLATYNGASMLPAQLNSFLGQSHKNWSLLVSDDGSTDSTRDIVRDFAAANTQHRVTLIRGPQKGSARNFLSLLRAAGSAPFVAFSDQDDVWLPFKLERAIDALREENTACVYGSRTIVTNQSLTPLRPSPLFRRPKTFANALVQNVTGGNTMVLNRAALDVLQPASRQADGIVAHDWWCYQMITGVGGQMLYDEKPTLLYRQHHGNQIGANDGLWAMANRLTRLSRGDFGKTLRQQHADLSACEAVFEEPAKSALRAFQGVQSSTLSERQSAFKASGAFRQTRRGSLALRAAVLAGRL